MNQVIAFQSPTGPVPVSAQNPLPIVFVDAPAGGAGRPGVRALVVAFQGADGQPRQVAVSEANPLPIVL